MKLDSNALQIAEGFFARPERWTMFTELIRLKADQEIRQIWFNRAAKRLFEIYAEDPVDGWLLTDWGVPRDLWWHLEGTDRESVGVGFGWDFWWCLGTRKAQDEMSLSGLLKKDEYLPLRSAFGLADDSKPEWVRTALARRPVFRDPAHPETMPDLNALAWHAGSNTNEFATQHLSCLRKVIADPVATRLIKKLNTELARGAC